MSVKDFQIISKLGEGAYSSVYKVKRLSDGQEYALKKVKLANLSDKEKQNALNEVRILASIRHVNMISYKEAFIDENSNSLCIVMEYADNGDLYHKITEYQKKGSLMSENEIWNIFIQIVKGLKALHDLKIFHRDLKSANVFLNKDGTVKLGDMNVSKVAKKGLLYTQTGTPYYASPEVWRDQPYDSKSDIWSLGCVLYEMVTLKPPFRAEDMEGLYKKVLRGFYPKIPSHFSQDLNNIIRALLQVSPHLRPNCDKILQLPAVLKRMDEKHLTEADDIEKNILLSTIRFPKNILYLTERLPKANYAPMRTRTMDKKKFLQTLAGVGQRHNDSFEALIDRGAESVDHHHLRRKQEIDNPLKEKASLPPLRDMQKAEILRAYGQREREKPRLHPVKKPPTDEYIEKYSINVENEISKIKKQLESRRVKEEEERRKIDREVKAKELQERELNRQKEIEPYLYTKPPIDPIRGRDGAPGVGRVRPDLLPASYLGGHPKDPHVLNHHYDSTDPTPLPDKSSSIVHQIYNAKPSRRLPNENSPYRPNVHAENANKIGGRALMKNASEQRHVPDLFDAPISKGSKLPPVSSHIEIGKNAKLPPLLKSPEDMTPLSYGKQKLREISKVYKVDGGSKGNGYSNRGGYSAITDEDANNSYKYSLPNTELHSKRDKSKGLFDENSSKDIIRYYKNPQIIDSH